MRRFGMRCVWLLAALACFAADSLGATTVVVVRHAEKEPQVAHGDPALTEAGEARAEELLRMLADAPVVAVFSSPLTRTKETVRPVAEHFDLEIAERPPRAVEELAEEIRSADLDGVVVVAGHSNTVPDMLRALGVETALSLTDEEYDDFFAVTLHEDGSATLLHLHYGAVSE